MSLPSSVHALRMNVTIDGQNVSWKCWEGQLQVEAAAKGQKLFFITKNMKIS